MSRWKQWTVAILACAAVAVGMQILTARGPADLTRMRQAVEDLGEVA